MTGSTPVEDITPNAVDDVTDHDARRNVFVEMGLPENFFQDHIDKQPCDKERSEGSVVPECHWSEI
jgi:hypothetical protein